jgi:hypothetical protein
VWLLLLGSLLTLCYLPVLFGRYGFSDDYRLLAFYDRGGILWPLAFAEGRPLHALWGYALLARFPDIDSLASLRFLNVLVLALTACAYACVWLYVGARVWEAFAVAVATFTLPPFQVLVAVASMGFVLIAIAASLFSAWIAHTAVRKGSNTRRLISFAVAAALLVIAMALYQPGAMFYAVTAGVLLLAGNPPIGQFSRALRVHALVGLVGILAAVALYKIGGFAYAAELAGLQRGYLATDPFAKLEWFISRPLLHALNLWNLLPSTVLAIATAALLVMCLRQHFATAGDAALKRIALSLILLPVCYLPNLVVAESWSSYRSQISLVSLVCAYLFVGLRTLTRKPRTYRIALAALVIVGLATAIRNVTLYFVLPQSKELALVRDFFTSRPLENEHLQVLLSDYSDSLAPIVAYDEFGRPSSSQPWSAVSMPYLVLRELQPQRDTAELRVVVGSDGRSRMAITLDYGELLRNARQKPD